MAGDPMRFRNPAGHAGLINNLMSLANSLAGFFESRVQLFARESKGAFVHLLLLAGAVMAALVLLVSGYIFLIAAAIVALAQSAQISWLWTALAAAVLHFVLALVFLLIARSRMTKPMFRASAEELKKDSEWLKNLANHANR